MCPIEEETNEQARSRTSTATGVRVSTALEVDHDGPSSIRVSPGILMVYRRFD
jgi:hypothetical protein